MSRVTRWLTARAATRKRVQVFERIYHENAWLGSVSRCGIGSDLSHTDALRQALPKLIDEFDVSSLLDCPCGDFYWMSQTSLGAVSYTGIDIVREVIGTNRRAFAAPGRRFVSGGRSTCARRRSTFRRDAEDPRAPGARDAPRQGVRVVGGRRSAVTGWA